MASASAAALSDAATRTVFKTALCVVPPPRLWPSIQAIRSQHDKSYLRWMPHINVAFPFVEEARATEAAALLAREFAGRGLGPFRVRADRAGYFAHGKRSSTVWLHPACDGDELCRVQDAVQSAMPACSHLRDKAGDGVFRPHLSLMQLGGGRAGPLAAEAVTQQGLAGSSEALALVAAGKGREVASMLGADSGRRRSGEAASGPGAGQSPASSRSGEVPGGGGLEAEGLSWVVSELCVVARSGFDTPFRVVAWVPLAGTDGAGDAPMGGGGSDADDVATAAADRSAGAEATAAGSASAAAPEDQAPPVGFVYEPAAPPEGARCLRKGSNGPAILAARLGAGAD